VLGCVDALLEISRHYWWAWPIRLPGRIPVVAGALHRSYRWIALHRHCLNGQCEIKRPDVKRFSHATNFLPLLILPMVAMFLRPHVADWVFMWAMVLSGVYAWTAWKGGAR
jgi:hypothetical protein